MSLAAASLAAKSLDIYVIDVEGGKSVLLVSPSGQSMLFDTGWPASNNRQASTDRIVEVVKAAGVKRIDFLVISHYDIDHIGDVPALVAKIPVGRVFDHGGSQPNARFTAYAAVRDKVGHTVLKPGDKVPIQGVDIQVLTAGGGVIRKKGTPNPLCESHKQAAELPSDFEDDNSIGLLITFGKFRMLDLADLEAHHSHDLVCPENRIGHVSVYNVNVHGQYKGIAPELVGALQAPVFIQANGPKKGADALSWPVLKAAPGLKDIWQLHTSLNAGKDANPPEDFIANLEPSDGFRWIEISAAKSGKFTVTNTRNGFRKAY
ncbi:MAG: MBL fold metallo-hydrolase [Acidobacteriota bacterium]|nr:MBL fold metallo-hydrolase [Acidobacteriota bacterium]